MKLKIINDDGSIEGWFMSGCITVAVFGMGVTALWSDSVCQRWEKIGASLVPLYLGQFTAWLAYRWAKQRGE